MNVAEVVVVEVEADRKLKMNDAEQEAVVVDNMKAVVDSTVAGADRPQLNHKPSLNCTLHHTDHTLLHKHYLHTRFHNSAELHHHNKDHTYYRNHIHCQIRHQKLADRLANYQTDC